MEPIVSVQELGKIIRKERKRQGYTQSEMADLCGVGLTFVSHLENGKPTAELGKALHILQMLGFDLVVKPRTS